MAHPMRHTAVGNRVWNIVATIRGNEFRRATRVLGEFGRVKRTPFYNVVVADVSDPQAMLDRLQTRLSAEPNAAGCLSRVVPVVGTFEFHSKEELEASSEHALADLAPALAAKSFHVRVHHRGVRGMSSRDEERRFDVFLLDALERQGKPGRIAFVDPDAVIAVEIVGSRAGVSMWTRDELRRYPLLHLD